MEDVILDKDRMQCPDCQGKMYRSEQGDKTYQVCSGCGNKILSFAEEEVEI